MIDDDSMSRVLARYPLPARRWSPDRDELISLADPLMVVAGAR